MANLAGFKNARSAQVCFGSTKKKIQALPVSKPKLATPTKRPAATPNAKGGDEDTPSKKRKRTKTEVEVDDEDAIEIKEEA